MSEHKEAARYHREQVGAEVRRQGSSGLSQNGFAESRARQMEHQQAARNADAAHAASTGQTVRYTPVGDPVFSKK